MSSVKSVSIAAVPRPYEGFSDQYISGRWRAGKFGTALIDTDPYTSNTLVEIPNADASDLDEAYRAAAHAQRLWAATAPHERAQVIARAAEIMKARHDEMLDWLISETGSTRAKAEIEWHFAVGITAEAATFPHRAEGRLLPSDAPGKESRAYRQPLGVVGVISPWNFPLYLTQRSVAPALALGNAVVIKPAGETPVTGGLLLAKIFEEAGLPAGLLNVVIGQVEEIGDAFTLHPVPRMISFTGSTRIGRRVGSLAMTAPQIKRVALELGGNAPLVVLDDADLEHAVRSAVVGRFLHQGQICMSSNRIIVDAKVHDAFVERFVAHVRTLKYGDPRDPAVSIGPVISQKQLTAHFATLKLAHDTGAKQLLGGEAQGLVLPPHVFVNVKNDSVFAQSEMFGPIAPIIKVSGDEEALRVANETEFGLSSAVFTQDQERGVRFALGIEAGMTHINDHSVDDSRSGPFGGEKNSGLGRFGGEWILHELTRDHWVTIQQNKGPYPF
ncbi:aldehyde dehydrogenase family protein [Paraburkholderia sp. BCC1885]|uniref:aldehyde dehydrogenase family protein n=1 Tax=Paraburkholderia sp. BCC1885 TaxID=2562669 RepID=UPI001182CAF9|nr:aldehyde dehydrogenase family protein [Paraburkholderia sp. BCC1885]